jgi:capsular exopolysaccharide synthesis family protein
VTLLSVGLGLFVSSRQTPIFESDASILVTPVETGNETIPAEVPYLATEAELMSSVTVARIASENIGHEGPPGALLRDLDVVQPTDTEILEIHYRDPSAEIARVTAAGFAEAYLAFREDVASRAISERAQNLDAQIDELEKQIARVEAQRLRLPDDDPRQASLLSEAGLLGDQLVQTQVARFNLPDDITGGRIIQPASLPTAPVSPNHVVNGLLGLIGGLALGIGQALVRDRMSGRLRSAEEVEDYLDAPVLAIIPRIPEWRRRKQAFMISLSRRHSPASEAYRILRTGLMSAASASRVKSIVVTSAHSGEGKSATVANLGAVLARAGKRVALVSADLRRPRLHDFFRAGETMGLSDVLTGRLPLEKTVQDIELTVPAGQPLDRAAFSLSLLPSGRVPADPAELLSSPTMAAVLDELEETFDFVLIDAPPILPVTDAALVARAADGVLLVIGPNSCTRATVMSARQQLDRVGARVLGGVLNGPNAIKTQPYGYY